MTGITDQTAPPLSISKLHQVSRMRKRIISAFVLAALAWWSVPVGLAAPPTHHAPTAQGQAQHTASRVHDHSCCSDARQRFVPILLVTAVPGGMPCEQHPCCAKQAPENPSSLPAATRISRPNSDVLHTISTHQVHSGRSGIGANISSSAAFQSYSARSTVFRI